MNEHDEYVRIMLKNPDRYKGMIARMRVQGASPEQIEKAVIRQYRAAMKKK